jgi:hypothetical protein
LSADIHLVWAEGAVRGGDPLKAKAELTEANRMWGQIPVDPVFQAVSERVRGQMLLLAGDAQGAGEAFDKESVHWQQCRRFAENAASLERAALTWHQAGDAPGAAARMYRAARVRLGLEHFDKAHLLAGLAAEWAGSAALPDLKSRALALAKETEKPVTP